MHGSRARALGGPLRVMGAARRMANDNGEGADARLDFELVAFAVRLGFVLSHLEVSQRMATGYRRLAAGLQVVAHEPHTTREVIF